MHLDARIGLRENVDRSGPSSVGCLTCGVTNHHEAMTFGLFECSEACDATVKRDVMIVWLRSHLPVQSNAVGLISCR